MASWPGRTALAIFELVGTDRARHMASWSGRTALAIFRAGRDGPRSPYSKLVGTDRAHHLASWSIKLNSPYGNDYPSNELPLPEWGPGFTPGDGSGTSKIPLSDCGFGELFSDLPPNFDFPPALDEPSR
ncbi:hypothetical protein Bca52824_002991 [Brassica carinata]|uniref:Uncharacterized protein n=1 Tax=Brassica carinata TaxID=52824 RepID=A0A8X7WLC4_BRACI|nr:hypothetical protein Bca52824_002991 [Brassica carinata]